jgi:hypothetical protein
MDLETQNWIVGIILAIVIYRLVGQAIQSLLSLLCLLAGNSMKPRYSSLGNRLLGWGDRLDPNQPGGSLISRAWNKIRFGKTNGELVLKKGVKGSSQSLPIYREACSQCATQPGIQKGSLRRTR